MEIIKTAKGFIKNFVQRIGAWRCFVAVPDFVSGIKLQNEPDNHKCRYKIAPNPMMEDSGSKVLLPGCHAPIRWTELRMTKSLQVEKITKS